MKIINYALFLMLICIFFSCSGEERNKIGNENVIIGNSLKKVRLIDVIPSSCNNDLFAELLKDRIVDSYFRNDTLIMNIAFSENCCIDFNPAIDYSNDSNTLNIILDNSVGEKTLCNCICCYQLSLVIVGIEDSTFKTKLKGREIFLSEDIYEEGSEDALREMEEAFGK